MRADLSRFLFNVFTFTLVFKNQTFYSKPLEIKGVGVKTPTFPVYLRLCNPELMKNLMRVARQYQRLGILLPGRLPLMIPYKDRPKHPFHPIDRSSNH